MTTSGAILPAKQERQETVPKTLYDKIFDLWMQDPPGVPLIDTYFSIAYNLGSGGAEGTFWPVLFLTLALAVPLGALSWYLVERPMMRFKYKRKPRREPV